jgi:hypothetical protein
MGRGIGPTYVAPDQGTIGDTAVAAASLVPTRGNLRRPGRPAARSRARAPLRSERHPCSTPSSTCDASPTTVHLRQHMATEVMRACFPDDPIPSAIVEVAFTPCTINPMFPRPRIALRESVIDRPRIRSRGESANQQHRPPRPCLFVAQTSANLRGNPSSQCLFLRQRVREGVGEDVNHRHHLPRQAPNLADPSVREVRGHPIHI